MRNPMSNDAEVRANQDDRELFATLNDMQGGPNVMSSTIRAGQADDHPGVQAFARHRLAAEARSHDGDHVGEVNDMVERCARVCDDIAAEWRSKEKGYREAGNNGPYLGTPSASTCAQAIRSLSAVPLLDEGRL